MKKEHIVKAFNNLTIYNIDLKKLRSKNFYKDMISNRASYYKTYKKYLNKKKIPVICVKKIKAFFLQNIKIIF